MRNKSKWVSLIATGFVFLSVPVFSVQAVDHGEIQASDIKLMKPETGPKVAGLQKPVDAGEIQASDLETRVDPQPRSLAGVEKGADHGEIQASDVKAN